MKFDPGIIRELVRRSRAEQGLPPTIQAEDLLGAFKRSGPTPISGKAIDILRDEEHDALSDLRRAIDSHKQDIIEADLVVYRDAIENRVLAEYEDRRDSAWLDAAWLKMRIKELSIALVDTSWMCRICTWYIGPDYDRPHAPGCVVADDRR